MGQVIKLYEVGEWDFKISHIAFQILPKCLFAILSSLEKDIPDSLDILALVEANKPLKPLVNVELKFIFLVILFRKSETPEYK